MKTLTLLLLAAPAFAADPPSAKLSGPKAVEVGSAIILNPTGSVGDVEFGLASGPGPAPVIRLKSDDGSTVIGFGTAAVPGTYVFVCTAWGEPVEKGRPAHSFAFWTVQVGDVKPPEPPPDEDPADIAFPPLRAAFRSDRGTVAQAKALAEVFRTAAKSSANDQNLRTVGALYKVVADAGTAAVGSPQTALPTLREAVAKELDRQLPVAAAAQLDAALRQRFSEQFARVAKLLEALK